MAAHGGADAGGSPSKEEARVQRRSASVLKNRVLESERHRFAKAIEWARADDALERAAAAIVGSRRRYVFGAAKSFTYASLLAADLSASLANVTLIDGTIVRPLDVLSDVRSSDVLIAFSLARYRRYTIQTAVPFVKAGGTLVLITDAADAPLAEYASESVIVGAAESADGGAEQSSPTAVALVIHVLATLCTASAKGAGRRTQERDRLAESLGLYES